MKKFLAIALATLTFSGPVSADTIRIDNSPGGWIQDFLNIRARAEHRGDRIAISRQCASACLIYTGMQNVCVVKNSYFLLHQGTHELGTDIMMKKMNPHIWQWVEHGKVHLPTFASEEYLYLDSKTVVKHHWMKYC